MVKIIGIDLVTLVIRLSNQDRSLRWCQLRKVVEIKLKSLRDFRKDSGTIFAMWTYTKSHLDTSVDGNAFPPTVAPSAAGTNVGLPPIMTAAAELLVPKSIPIIFTIFNLPPVFLIFQLATYEQHYHVKYILF